MYAFSSESNSDSDTSGLGSDTGGSLFSRHQHIPSSNPHVRQTESCRKFLDVSGDISGRVLEVLTLMDSLHLNLPLFLWAISWNVPELVSNDRVRFARTALMLSDELPGILANWHWPPRSHGQGIRTKAARDAMNNWALETVCEIMDHELDILKPTMLFPQENLSEDALLSISWKEMIPEVKSQALTMWKLFHHALRTPKQRLKNKLTNPDPVSVLCFVSDIMV